MEWNTVACFSVLVLITTARKVALAAPASDIGISYGMMSSNLPPASQVVALLQRCGIQRVRIYEPNREFMEALKNSGRILTMGVHNQDLHSFASSSEVAQAWVNTNIAPYAKQLNIAEIVVGNEVVGSMLGQYIVGAMRNIRSAVDAAGFGNVLITTAISGAVLTNTYPPSQSTFTAEAASVMTEVLSYINSLPSGIKPQLYVHLYPYFAYASNPANIRLDYALFESPSIVFMDGKLEYWNLYDAMYDAFVWAMEKNGGAGINLVVGETGWPSQGNGQFTSPQLASRYITNLYNHVVHGNGTPKLRGSRLNGLFVFGLFNEDQKQPQVEQNWGLFYPNMQPIYSTPLCG